MSVIERRKLNLLIRESRGRIEFFKKKKYILIKNKPYISIQYEYNNILDFR